MNLDFSAEPLFSWYVVLLGLSGAALIALAAVKAGGQSTGWRIFNAVVGAGFVGYGFYLGFIFQGGTYIIFAKAFIVPVLLIANFFKSLAARRNAVAAQPVPAAQPPYAEQPAAPETTVQG